jgi:hypothetical protein
MLAPLKDRSILEIAPADTLFDEPASSCDITAELFAEIDALKLALRQSRDDQRRSALDSTARIIAQANEISHLQDTNISLKKSLHTLESGVAITQLGQKLMDLSARNDMLSLAVARLSIMEKALNIACRECEYLVDECEIAFHQTIF